MCLRSVRLCTCHAVPSGSEQVAVLNSSFCRESQESKCRLARESALRQVQSTVSCVQSHLRHRHHKPESAAAFDPTSSPCTVLSSQTDQHVVPMVSPTCR